MGAVYNIIIFQKLLNLKLTQNDAINCTFTGPINGKHGTLARSCEYIEDRTSYEDNSGDKSSRIVELTRQHKCLVLANNYIKIDPSLFNFNHVMIYKVNKWC